MERLSVIDSVGQYNTHCTTIISLGDGFKPLLPCSVPNLKSDFMFANVDGFNFEIDSYGRKMRGHEVVLCESKQHICLTNPTVSNY